MFHFRLLFKGSQFMFPIRGALRYNLANSDAWTVFERQAYDTPQGLEGIRPFPPPPLPSARPLALSVVRARSLFLALSPSRPPSLSSPSLPPLSLSLHACTGESYKPLGCFAEEPDATTITRLIQDDVRKQSKTLPQI